MGFLLGDVGDYRDRRKLRIMKKPRIITRIVRRLKGRDIVVVDTVLGRIAFYKRTGRGGDGGLGACAGHWAPFFGLYGGLWVVKPGSSWGDKDEIYRYGVQELKKVGEWLDEKDIPEGREMEWDQINKDLSNLGIVGEKEKIFGGIRTNGTSIVDIFYMPMSRERFLEKVEENA